MQSRDRILFAYQHKEGDRVPLFEQAVADSVASEILGRKAFTGSASLHREEAEAWLRGEQAHQEFLEKTRQDIVALARKLEFDAIRTPWLLGEKPTKKLDAYTYLYGDLASDRWTIRKYDPVSQMFGIYDSSDNTLDIDGLERRIEKIEQEYRTKTFSNDDFTELIAYRTYCGDDLEVFGYTAMCIPYYPPIWLEAIVLRPDLIERWLDALLDYEKKSVAVQKTLGIRVVFGGGDFADKNGPFYGPKVFRRMVVPRLHHMTEYCHSLGIYYSFSSDGNLWSVADELFLESGIDGYGEIDIDSGMDLAEVKRRYGHRITLWGGLSCGTILLQGTKQAVIDATKKAIDAAAPGGGYIFGSSNIIMSGTPVENVYAAFETAKEYGKYNNNFSNTLSSNQFHHEKVTDISNQSFS
ncbi:MAG: uroporphyrinogen decarboxylase family protein [bacterium]|nr:uroporphyrinogen decarboxylase family protein [bacterium]